MDNVLQELDDLIIKSTGSSNRESAEVPQNRVIQTGRDGDFVKQEDTVNNSSSTLFEGADLIVPESSSSPFGFDVMEDIGSWHEELNLRYGENKEDTIAPLQSFFSAKPTEQFESLSSTAIHPWGKLALGSLFIHDTISRSVDTAANSSSMTRAVGRGSNTRERTRGRIGNRPFAPGGIDESSDNAKPALHGSNEQDEASNRKLIQELFKLMNGQTMQLDSSQRLKDTAPGCRAGLNVDIVQQVLDDEQDELKKENGPVNIDERNSSSTPISNSWTCASCQHLNNPSGGTARLWCAICGYMPEDTMFPETGPNNSGSATFKQNRAAYNQRRSAAARDLAQDTQEFWTETHEVDVADASGAEPAKSDPQPNLEETSAEEETLLLSAPSLDEGARASRATAVEAPAEGSPLDSIDDLLRDVDEMQVQLAAQAAALDPLALHRQRERQKLGADAPANGQPAESWAVTAPIDVTQFHHVIPQMAIEYPFELDSFQKQAVLHLEQGDSVFVAAHTSAGKTVVAEYAVALAMEHRTRVVYTSPIKALSNQKYRDFQKRFSPEEVGLITGDVSVNPGASCLVMTTEILRSMLYRGADLIRDLEWVVFDEVHYVNDSERGVVWEEVIIMLPDHVGMVFLSATTPNTKEFSSWVGRTKQRKVHVISTEKRPVPLEHFLYAGGAMHKVLDSRKRFLTEGHVAATRALRSAKENFIADNHKKGARALGTGSRQQQQQRWSQQRGTGSKASEKEAWLTMVRDLARQGLLPVVVFSFSKKQCEERAAQLVNVDLSSAKEKSQAHLVLARALKRLQGSDRELPQVLRVKALAEKGVAVHHGGLLPILKEVVEILFARGLVKVLFATETFAMGVNMPARTVVYNGLRKHDGRTFRDLLPGEYTQMAGRAGRRGLDTVGTVLVACSPERGPPPVEVLHGMMTGQPTKLESQFRLTYNMILNLLRVAELSVADMIKRSFSEFGSQRLFGAGDLQVLVSRGKARARAIREEALAIAPEGVREEVARLGQVLQRAVSSSRVLLKEIAERHFGPKAHSAAFCRGRVVMVSRRGRSWKGSGANAGWVVSPAIVLEDLQDGAFDQVANQFTGSKRSVLVLGLPPSNIQTLNDVPEEERFPRKLNEQQEASGKKDEFAGMTIGKKKSDDFAGMTIGKKKSDDFAGMTIGKKKSDDFAGMTIGKKKNDDFAGMTIGKKKNDNDFGMFGGGRSNKKGKAVSKSPAKSTQEIFDFVTNLPDVSIGITSSQANPQIFSVLKVELDDIIAISSTTAPKAAAVGDIIHSMIDTNSTTALEQAVEWLAETASNNKSDVLFGGDLRNFPVLDPVKELKVADIDFVSEWHAHAQAIGDSAQLASHLSQHTGRLAEMVASLQQVSRIEGKVAVAQLMCSDENMALYPDFQARLGVLERLGFISPEDNAVHLKGRVACEINTCDELLLSELVFQNIFQDLDPAECVAALSALVLQTKCKDEPHLNPALENARTLMVRVAANLEVVQKRYQVELEGDWLEKCLNFGLMEVVYMWAKGMKFFDICQLTTMEEGSIVRCITRLHETCREVRNVAQVIGDPILLNKMEQASELIKRDIVFATSLYVG